jgi:hypothetical protein
VLFCSWAAFYVLFPRVFADTLDRIPDAAFPYAAPFLCIPVHLIGFGVGLFFLERRRVGCWKLGAVVLALTAVAVFGHIVCTVVSLL